MNIGLAIIGLSAGFVLLIKGADFLVDGAVCIARHLGISNLAVGLTVVAFGTSMPELFVNITAGISGKTDLAVGNVLGSNIANVLLILGISAVIYPLEVTKGTVWKEIPFSLLATVVLALMANDRLLDDTHASMLGRIDGFVLLCFFGIFIYVAVGTSLPELATSAVAAWKKNPDIAVGNVVGSNIFNIFFILGIGASIRPLPFREGNNIDIGMVLLSSLLLFVFMFTGKKHSLDRWEGALFLLLYAGYLFFLVTIP